MKRGGLLVMGWALLATVLVGAAPDTRLIDAIRRGDVDAVRKLIQQGVDLNQPQPDGATVLHWVAHRDNVAIADLLINAGAKVDAADDGGITPLGLACNNASPAMVGRLLKAGANPNHGTRETPVMLAAQTGNVEVMKLLLVRTRSSDGSSRCPLSGATAPRFSWRFPSPPCCADTKPCFLHPCVT